MKKINKKKIIKSISVIIGLIALIILFISNNSFSHTEINYRKINIISGDTLWSIAKYEQCNNPYFENKNIRDIVDEIKYINKLNNSSLKVGEQLSVPIM